MTTLSVTSSLLDYSHVKDLVSSENIAHARLSDSRDVAKTRWWEIGCVSFLSPAPMHFLHNQFLQYLHITILEPETGYKK